MFTKIFSSISLSCFKYTLQIRLLLDLPRITGIRTLYFGKLSYVNPGDLNLNFIWFWCWVLFYFSHFLLHFTNFRLHFSHFLLSSLLSCLNLSYFLLSSFFSLFYCLILFFNLSQHTLFSFFSFSDCLIFIFQDFYCALSRSFILFRQLVLFLQGLDSLFKLSFFFQMDGFLLASLVFLFSQIFAQLKNLTFVT